MEVTRIRALRGPNLWSRHTAIEAIVRCEPEERAIRQGDALELRLRKLLPETAAVRPVGDTDAVPLARWLERLTLALQARAGCQVSFARTSQAPEEGVYQISVEYTEEKVGRRAFDLHACELA